MHTNKEGPFSGPCISFSNAALPENKKFDPVFPNSAKYLRNTTVEREGVVCSAGNWHVLCSSKAEPPEKKERSCASGLGNSAYRV
jgi:hypothetical protein